MLRHLPWLTPEEVDEILERRDAEDMERLDVAEAKQEEETAPEGQEEGVTNGEGQRMK